MKLHKSLLLFGASVLILAACGDGGNVEDTESAEEVETVEVGTEAEAETEDATGYTRQPTEQTLEQLQSIPMGKNMMDPEGGATVEEISEILGAQPGAEMELDDTEDGKTEALAFWESPRNGTEVSVLFIDGGATVIELKNEKAEPMTQEEFDAIDESSVTEFQSIIDKFGIPYDYQQYNEGGFMSQDIRYNAAGEDEFQTFRISIQDGVVTSKR